MPGNAGVLRLTRNCEEVAAGLRSAASREVTVSHRRQGEVMRGSRARRSRGVKLVGAGVVWLALAPGIAHAAVFTVGSRADAVDANAGDGKCAAADGACTLRAAVQEANAASGPSTVKLPAGRYVLTIPPVIEAGTAADMDASNGDLDLNGD